MNETVWGIESVEEALVQHHELWWRSPGDGRWPFASDGPWHLMQGEAGDYAGDGQDAPSSSARPRTPLSVAEVAERDKVAGWLQLLDDATDARAVWFGTAALWRGEPKVPWREIARRIGWSKTDRALAWRYRKALARIVCRLNGWPITRARTLAV